MNDLFHNTTSLPPPASRLSRAAASSQKFTGHGFTRKLGPSDTADIKAHFLRLKPEDRRLRFFGHVGDETIERYCSRLEWSKTVMTGYLAGGVLKAVSHLALPDHDNQPAELAISVESELQNRGIGTELLRLSLISARNRDIIHIHMTCLLENAKMRRVASKYADDYDIVGSEIHARTRQDGPDFSSRLEESLNDGAAAFRTLLDPLNWYRNIWGSQ